MLRSTLISLLLLFFPGTSTHWLLHFIVLFLLTSISFPFPLLLTFVLRLRLHVAPPECQVLTCWCQSTSPSWHGPCTGWRRTPAPLWPVSRPPDTLEILYPNSGPPQLLEWGKQDLVTLSATKVYLSSYSQRKWLTLSYPLAGVHHQSGLRVFQLLQ